MTCPIHPEKTERQYRYAILRAFGLTSEQAYKVRDYRQTKFNAVLRYALDLQLNKIHLMN